MTDIRPGVQLQNMQEPYRRVVEDIVNLSMKVEEDITEIDWKYLAERNQASRKHHFQKRKEAEAELATLRAERDEWKSASRSQGNIIMLMQGHMGEMRAENERLRILVKDSVNLLDFLFEPGSYVPAVRLFCEKVKEELK